MLFDIFDVDEDGVFNENELNLFLYYILNIDPDNQDNNSDNKQDENGFDINKIIIKSNFFEYIEDLISPKDDKTDDTTTTTATNGQTTNGENTKDSNDKNEDENIDDNDKENDNESAKDNKDADDNANIKPDTSSESVDVETAEKRPLKNGKNIENIVDDNIEFANMSLSDLKNCDSITLLDTIKKLLTEKLFNKNKVKFYYFCVLFSFLVYTIYRYYEIHICFVLNPVKKEVFRSICL